MLNANIINIERCATDDGPGIRTVVFFKGCELRCKWCSNPESQLFTKEVLLYPSKCIGCGKCIENCEYNAITIKKGFGPITDISKCKFCEKCINDCFAGARVIQGKTYDVDELMLELIKDEVYYNNSGGGITFSGGEPLYYSTFIKECIKKIHERGFTCLIETSCYVPLKNIKEVIDDVDYFFCDFKEYDSLKHKALTGKDNKLIIENIKWITDNFKGDVSIRYPFIRGLNDSEKEVIEFLKFAKSLKRIKEVVFLPYHRLGTVKYEGLGRDYDMGNTEPYKVQDIKYLKKYENEFGLNINIY